MSLRRRERTTMVDRVGRWLVLLGLGAASIGALAQPAQAQPSRAETLPAIGTVDYRAPVHREEAGDAAAIGRVFEAKSYALREVRRTGQVPRLYVLQVPPDLSELTVGARKELFVALLLPSILKANDGVLAQRRTLDELLARQGDDGRLSEAERDWLDRLGRAYRVESGDWDELRRRVDVVPPSLAIAQAIDESAWGTSRFAREGNALFGEHLPPHSGYRFIESEHGHVKVAAFDTVPEGVLAFLHHLNTSTAYQRLRDQRARERAKGERLDGHDLSAGLEHYSERGGAYVKELRTLMKQQRLQDYDDAALAPGGALTIERAR